MKKKLSMLLVSLLAVVLAFALVACGGGKLTLSDESLALTVGDTKQLTLKEGETDVSKDAEWTTSDEKVVTVSTRGNVSARAAGTATVTATYKGKSATCSVSVKAREVVTVTITNEAGEEIKTASVERNATITLKATTSNDSEVTWTSGDTTYATVAPVSGQKNTVTVKGVFPTAAPVKIYAKSGSTQASIDLTVTAPAGNPTWYDMVARNEDGTPVDGAGSVGQNKSPLGKWTFWRDQAGWNNGNADMGTAEYLGDSTDSMAGSIHLSYTNGSRSVSNNVKAPDTVQITFRSPKTAEFTNGLLETGKYYKLTAEITVDFEGVVTINGTETLLHSGKNNVEIWFQHTDDGAMHGATDYDIYQFPAFYMTMGSYKEDTFVPEADITIAKLQWTEFTPEALKAPTVAVANGKATVTDTVNDAANVDGYEIGFFATADAQTPKYTLKAQAGETTINSASWDNGTYIVKVRALPASGKYQASPWSAATDVTYTVEHEALVYDLPFSGGDNVNITSDGWYYYNELGEKTEEDAHGIVEAKYNDGTLTYEFNETAGSWYSQQLFYNNTSLAAGSYTVTFKFTSSAEGTIRICGTYYEFTAGETKTITATAAPGIMISIQFGKATDDWQSTASAIQAGRFTITDIDIANGGSQPATPDALTAGGEGDAKTANDGWKYWHADHERNWTTENVYATVEVTEAKREEGVITLKFKGTENWLDYGFQLFYNDPTTYPVGSQYKLTLHVKAIYACTVTFNGQAETFTAGEEKDVEVTFTYNFHLDNVVDSNYGISLFDMQVKTEEGKDYELTLSNIKWEPAEAPAETLGEAINAKYTAVRKGAEKKDVNDPDGADVSPNVWILWWREWDPVVTMNEGYKIENNVLTFSFSGGPTDGDAGWATQLFYNNSELTQGKTYRLFMKINSSAAYTITVNGTSVALVEGDNDVNVKFTLAGDVSAVDIQFPSPDAHTIKISDVYWKEVNPTGGQPEPPAGATQMTKVSSAAEATEAGKWYYYAKENVTVTKAEVAADGTITFIYSGATAWDDVKIFYTPADVPDGEQRTILLTIKFDYEGEPGALTVSLNDNGNTCPGYGRGQEFTGQGFRFTKNAGSPMFQMTLGKDGVANPQGQVTLTLKVENVAP